MQKHFTLFLLTFFGTFSLFAQTPPYLFSVQNATYADLTNDISLVQEVWDDPAYSAPLGFDFTYLSTTNDSIFNFQDVGAGFTFSLRNDDNYYDAFDYLFAYGNDLIDRGAATGTPTSTISYAIEGNAGSRIFKLQYKDAGFFDEVSEFGTANNSVNVQLWLHEGSNDLEIHFGPSNLPIPIEDLGSFSGPFTAIIDAFEYYSFEDAWFLQGPSTNPEFRQLTIPQADTLVVTLDMHPANGTVYRFSPNPKVAVAEVVDHAESFEMFPTLFTDRVQAKVKNAEWIGDRAICQLIDGQGRVVQQFQQSLEPSLDLDWGHLPAGMYFFTLSTEDYRLTRQLIKQ